MGKELRDHTGVKAEWAILQKLLLRIVREGADNTGQAGLCLLPASTGQEGS